MDQPIHLIGGDVLHVPRRTIPPAELTWRHKLMAALMVHGSTDLRILATIERWEYRREPGEKHGTRVLLPSPMPGEPLAADEACRIVGIRQKNARVLADFPIFKRQLERERALQEIEREVVASPINGRD